MTVSGLRFPLQDLIEETKHLQKIAGDLLDQEDSWVLDRFVSDLEGARRADESSVLSLRLQPLRTRVTGAYEQGARAGKEKVFARITGTWDLRANGQARRPGRTVEFSGIASTKVEIRNDLNRLAMWRIELGSKDSPGSYFHNQILGDCEKPPFPKSLPIPRLPSLFVTPMAAVEFVLGELFQDKWGEATSRSRHPQKRWGAIQRIRLRALLDWQRRQIDQGDGGSPWMALKVGKPDAALFLPP